MVSETTYTVHPTGILYAVAVCVFERLQNVLCFRTSRIYGKSVNNSIHCFSQLIAFNWPRAQMKISGFVAFHFIAQMHPDAGDGRWFGADTEMHHFEASNFLMHRSFSISISVSIDTVLLSKMISFFDLFSITEANCFRCARGFTCANRHSWYDVAACAFQLFCAKLFLLWSPLMRIVSNPWFEASRRSKWPFDENHFWFNFTWFASRWNWNTWPPFEI